MGRALHTETGGTASFEKPFFMFVFGPEAAFILIEEFLRRFLQAAEAYHHREQTRRRG
jgi:hypothetical protein